ncbi:Organic solvent tolerance protein [Geotalea uraniireducens Rf4]|uniref:Organic solvent tolerance protein n=2 Tax=Geotalea uraniireducens TaxID=351604 RepID=A5G6L7_GEOUR|nr:Organic solvent tolerance protein [Geotalea uraniireducens Rf4]
MRLPFHLYGTLPPFLADYHERIMKHPIVLALFSNIFVLFLLFQVAFAEENSPAGGVKITADTLSYESRSATYQAKGNVRMRYDGVTLLADSVIFREEQSEAFASGGVVMERDGDVLHGDSLTLNTTTELGEVSNGDLFIKKPNFHIRSSKMTKVGTEDYRMERGSFTTCDGDSPSWRFTARDLDVTLEEYATGKDVVFYVKDLPLLYTPYIIFPVKRERQSGFLIPLIRNSSKKGFNFDLPFYWAISPSQDATFDLDIQSKRGVGTGLDYRYMRQRGSEGIFRGYGIFDTSQSRFRGAVVEKHLEAVSDSLNIRSDINMATDRDFYTDFAEVAGEYNRQDLESTVSLTKKWQDYALTAELRYVEDLYAPNNSATLQKLPAVSLTGIRRKIGATPLFFSLDSSLVNFYREEGVNGQRFTLHPTVTTYFQPVSALDVSAFAGYGQRLYNAYGADPGRGSHGEGLADAGVSASTRFARVYDTAWGAVRKVRHLLVPEVSYSFVQERSQDQLPFFDFDDRVVGQNLLTLSLTNYLTGKVIQADGSPVYRDLLYLRISQGYQASGSRRDLLTLVDEGRTLTDLRLESRFTPTPEISLNLDSRFNTYQGRFSTANLSADYSDGSDNRAGLGYRFSRGEVEYLEGRIGVALVKPFVFNYTNRYSFDKGGFIESYYALEYKHQCWSVTFSYRDRPDNREYMVTFNLAGIGAIGPIKAF